MLDCPRSVQWPAADLTTPPLRWGAGVRREREIMAPLRLDLCKKQMRVIIYAAPADPHAKPRGYADRNPRVRGGFPCCERNRGVKHD